MVGPTTPLVVLKLVPRFVLYFTESAKYASSAVTRFRRSDFIEARYAFSFVLANFGIAIAARMPMITTTISSSMSVKPLRFMSLPPCRGVSLHRYQCRGGDTTRQRPSHGRDAWRERVGIEPTEAQTSPSWF